MIAVVDSFCEFCGDHVATCCNLAMQWESGTSPILPQMDTNGPQGSVGSVQDLWQDAVGCSGFIRVYYTWPQHTSESDPPCCQPCCVLVSYSAANPGHSEAPRQKAGVGRQASFVAAQSRTTKVVSIWQYDTIYDIYVSIIFNLTFLLL